MKRPLSLDFLSNKRGSLQFLNRDRETLELKAFCMLEEDGVTIEVVADGVSYTFTCSMEGDIVIVVRTDGKKFGIRGLS